MGFRQAERDVECILVTEEVSDPYPACLIAKLTDSQPKKHRVTGFDALDHRITHHIDSRVDVRNGCTFPNVTQSFDGDEFACGMTRVVDERASCLVVKATRVFLEELLGRGFDRNERVVLVAVVVGELLVGLGWCTERNEREER